MSDRDPRDDALRSAIHALRIADERDAPAFGALIARPRHLAAWPVSRLVAAALLLAFGAGIGYSVSRRERFTVPSEVTALTTWRPMTDTLLTVPTMNFLRETQNVDSLLAASRLPLPTYR